MREKVAYLRSIGMSPSQVGVVLQRLPQLLSLDVRNNLVPKYRYLQAELGGTVDTVASYPAYFSLSLPLRCACYHDAVVCQLHALRTMFHALVSSLHLLPCSQDNASTSVSADRALAARAAVSNELSEVLRRAVRSQCCEHTTRSV